MQAADPAVITSDETRLAHQECVQKATTMIFNTTCGLDVQLSDSGLSLGDDGLVVAVISLVGDVDWSVFVCLPTRTASGAASKFAGFDIPSDSEDMGDAVGELANLLAGDVKMRLDSIGVRAEISLPSVMRAQKMDVLEQGDVCMTRFGFESSVGAFMIAMVTR